MKKKSRYFELNELKISSISFSINFNYLSFFSKIKIKQKTKKSNSFIFNISLSIFFSLFVDLNSIKQSTMKVNWNLDKLILLLLLLVLYYSWNLTP